MGRGFYLLLQRLSRLCLLCSQILFALEPRKEMRQVTVSLIIPCAAQHFIHLEPLLDLVANQTRIPNEVIVALSETKRLEKGAIDALEAKHFPYSLRLLRSEEKRSAGYNRNRACDVARGSVIITQDADDLLHPQKIEIVAYLFEKYPIDYLLHTYVFESDGFPLYRKEELIPRVFKSYDGAMAYSDCIANGYPSFTWQVGACVKWIEGEGLGEDRAFNQSIYRHLDWTRVVIDCPLIVYRNWLSSFNLDFVHFSQPFDSQALISLCNGVFKPVAETDKRL